MGVQDSGAAWSRPKELTLTLGVSQAAWGERDMHMSNVTGGTCTASQAVSSTEHTLQTWAPLGLGINEDRIPHTSLPGV